MQDTQFTYLTVCLVWTLKCVKKWLNELRLSLAMLRSSKGKFFSDTFKKEFISQKFLIKNETYYLYTDV